jgi:hypothetical protein
MSRSFIILRDHKDGSQPEFFYRIGLGPLWECGDQLENAFRFTSRDAAAAMLQQNGKHREGWRILRTDQV